MNEKKLEVAKIVVKPSKASRLQVINEINTGLYEALDSSYYSAYNVRKADDKSFVDIRSQPIGYYSNDKENSGQATISWDPTTTFSEKWVEKNGKVDKKEVAGECSTVYGRDFQRFQLVDMEGIIVLSGGKFLMNRYGKYEPNLSFINSSPVIEFQKISKEDLNFDKGNFDVIYGEFFVSKKGTKCFRILSKENAKHVLIRDDWGGAFNKYRGRTLPEDGAVYYRRARSNGGGSGYDYGVYEKNFKNILSEDDI